VQPISVKQLSLAALAYLAVGAGGSALLVSRGAPELVPAGLIAQAFVALLMFCWYRVDARIWRPRLGPGLALAGLCVLVPAWFARRSPWAMTPAFLAPELPLPVVAEGLDARLQTKARLTGRVLWWDEYPYGQGLAQPVKVRIENETGAADVILDRTALGRALEPGVELRMVGRIRKWEGEVVRFVALRTICVAPPATGAERP